MQRRGILKGRDISRLYVVMVRTAIYQFGREVLGRCLNGGVVKPQCRPFGRHWWGAVASYLT